MHGRHLYRITEGLRWAGVSGGHLVQLTEGHPEQVVQDHSQVPFEYLYGRRAYNLSGHPVLMFSHSPSNRVSPGVHSAPSMFQFVSIASRPVPERH